MSRPIMNKFRALLSFDTISTLLLICSVVINVGLARKVAALRQEAEDVARGQHLKPGKSVPPMEVKSLDGTPATVAAADSQLPTVFYVFSVTCHWNLDNLKALASAASGRYRFVGVSLDGDDPQMIADHASQNGLALPLYYAPSHATLKGYKLGGTPQTIIVSPDGKVIKVESQSPTYDEEGMMRAEQFVLRLLHTESAKGSLRPTDALIIIPTAYKIT